MLFLAGLALGFFAALSATDARAAACCGGASASPALISGDDAYQLGVAVSRSEVIGDAPAEGRAVFRGPGTDEVTETYRFDAAAILSDRIQASFRLPIVRRRLNAGDSARASSGVGDVAAGFAYEAWPEWSYSEWRPRGFLFAQLNVPVARSIYDARAGGAADAFGTGFYRLSAGALFVKAWRIWDANLVPELHYSFPRRFDGASGDSVRIAPGFGASADLGIGYNFASVRIGARLQPVWNQARVAETDLGETRASDQWVWNAGLEVSYLYSPEWSATASYVDQTLFGPAVNTTLSRTFAINLQRRWPR